MEIGTSQCEARSASNFQLPKNTGTRPKVNTASRSGCCEITCKTCLFFVLQLGYGRSRNVRHTVRVIHNRRSCCSVVRGEGEESGTNGYHPVAEGTSTTGANNIPTTQVQVAMGCASASYLVTILKEICRLYGKKDNYGTDKIDFIIEACSYSDTHVIAARITAQSPDEAFQPTSGSIEPENGRNHEFADSQFCSATC